MIKIHIGMPGKMSLVLIFCFLISKLITVGTPLLMNLNNMKLTAICMKKHSSKICIITLTVEYDIAIHLEFTGEICMQPREKVETASIYLVPTIHL